MAILISVWGVIISCVGLFMLLKPQGFADAIVLFSRQRYFHAVEIISRLMIGAALLLDADNTSFPLVFEVIANLLFTIAVFLVFMTEKYHKMFALWAGTHCISWFRPAGVSALIFGLWAVYVSIN